jgi:hypothetical protein
MRGLEGAPIIFQRAIEVQFFGVKRPQLFQNHAVVGSVLEKGFIL